jgi:hypothetical protein
MICKICKIKLTDIGYYLDMYGSKVKKEEFVCPNLDKHESILLGRLKTEPEICPICEDCDVDHEIQITNSLILIDYLCHLCKFQWSVSSSRVVIDFESGQEVLETYGEWE